MRSRTSDASPVSRPSATLRQIVRRQRANSRTPCSLVYSRMIRRNAPAVNRTGRSDSPAAWFSAATRCVRAIETFSSSL